jgi:hypothetical protein
MDTLKKSVKQYLREVYMTSTFRFLSRGGPGLEGFLIAEYYKTRSQNKKLFSDSPYLPYSPGKNCSISLSCWTMYLKAKRLL